MSEPDLPFHRIEAHKFEELAATVLEDKFQLPLLTFTSGRDRGRDAAARKVTFNIGGFPTQITMWWYRLNIPRGKVPKWITVPVTGCLLRNWPRYLLN